MFATDFIYGYGNCMIFLEDYTLKRKILTCLLSAAFILETMGVQTYAATDINNSLAGTELVTDGSESIESEDSSFDAVEEMPFEDESGILDAGAEDTEAGDNGDDQDLITDEDTDEDAEVEDGNEFVPDETEAEAKEDEQVFEEETEPVVEETAVEEEPVKVFWLDKDQVTLVFDAFGEDDEYEYSIVSLKENEELQSGTVKALIREKTAAAVIKLDEKLDYSIDEAQVKVILYNDQKQAAGYAVDNENSIKDFTVQVNEAGQAELSWDGESEDGFIVYASFAEADASEDESSFLVWEVSGSPFIIDDLDPESSYDFRIAACDKDEASEKTVYSVSSSYELLMYGLADQAETEEEIYLTEEEAESEADSVQAADAALTDTESEGSDDYEAVTNEEIEADEESVLLDAASKSKTADAEKEEEADEEDEEEVIAEPAEDLTVVSTTGNSVKLSWKKGDGADGYRIQKYDTKTGKKSWVNKGTTGVKYTVTGLKNKRTYKFRLLGFVKDGKEKIYSKTYTSWVEATTSKIQPAKPKGFKVKAGDESVVLTWKKAKNASGYKIEVMDVKTGEIKADGVTKNISYTVEDLENAKEYKFRVVSYRLVKKKKVFSPYSKWLSASPQATVPGVPDTLTFEYTKKGMKLTWGAVKKADGYIVYRYDYKKEKFKKVADVEDTTWVDEGNGKTGKFKYKIVAYRFNGKKKLMSDGDITKIVYGQDDQKAIAEIHPILYSATIRYTTDLYNAMSGGKKVGTVKGGTKVTVSFRVWNGRDRIILSDGKEYWVKPSAVRCSSDHYTSKDYTTEQKEAFIDSKGFGSKSKYLIWVSTYTQKVNIFTGSAGNWKLYKTTPCATGVVATFTPHGFGRLKSHERTHYASSGYSYYEWLTYFTSGNAFHTRIKKVSTGGYRSRTLGKPMSGGCVRVYDEIARFIYYDVPLGTATYIY